MAINISQFVGQLTDRCPVCDLPSKHFPGKGEDFEHVLCVRCGAFDAAPRIISKRLLRGFSRRQVANISGYIRENQGIQIKAQDVSFLVGLATPTVGERSLKLLRWMARRWQTPGLEIGVPTAEGVNSLLAHFASIQKSKFEGDTGLEKTSILIFPFLSACWAEHGPELKYLIFDYLRDSLGVLTGDDKGSHAYQDWRAHDVKITPEGWNQLQSSGQADSNTGFVAMWFDESLHHVWQDAFYPAIQAAGYSPLRMDKKQHNNRIDDEIIATIRGCRFVVADVTGASNGVYYEAGFAGGLGKPVIWTVRHDYTTEKHFDTRQFNHIEWRESDLDSFRKALQLRIEATLGPGPLKG
jgi:hypothetical protein